MVIGITHKTSGLRKNASVEKVFEAVVWDIATRYVVSDYRPKLGSALDGELRILNTWRQTLEGKLSKKRAEEIDWNVHAQIRKARGE